MSKCNECGKRCGKAETLPTGVRRVWLRGDMPGHPTGRYQARLMVNGKQVTLGQTYASKTDARDARNRALTELDRGEYVDVDKRKVTVNQWAEQWFDLSQVQSPNLRSFLRVHIAPALGDRKLVDLSPADVQRFVNGINLKPTTVRAIYELLSRMMATAVDHDYLAKTPCRNIRLPKAQKIVRQALTTDELLALQAAAPPRFRAMIHLGAWAGLRWQECAGLAWSDVDLEQGMLHVRQAVKARTNQLGETKNGKDRYVAISAATVEVLRAHRRDFASDDLVFGGQRRGRPLQYNYWHTVWQQIVKDAGVQVKGFHQLRHSYVTQMVIAGVDPKVISDQVGHGDASFTMRVYGSTRLDAADVVRSAISKQQSA